MKNLLLFLILTILFISCATSNRMTNKAIHHAIIGQNEKTIYSRLGIPTRTIPSPDQGKIMIYEYYAKGKFTTPYNSSVNYNSDMDLLGNREGFTFTSVVNTVTNDTKYTIYDTNVSYLKIYLNNQKNCVKFEQNLPREQFEIFYENFKHYLPKD